MTFITKSQKQGAKLIVNKRKYLKVFMLHYKINKITHLVYGKARVNNSIKLCLMTNNIL